VNQADHHRALRFPHNGSVDDGKSLHLIGRLLFDSRKCIPSPIQLDALNAAGTPIDLSLLTDPGLDQTRTSIPYRDGPKHWRFERWS
jgi:sulfate adenylyltransferase subunit 1 (EFTu-like GTPase family)